jgi:hypothetical protein
MARKNAAAVALGRKGGTATAKKRTPEERSEAARKAVQARWAKEDRERKAQIAKLADSVQALATTALLGMAKGKIQPTRK